MKITASDKDNLVRLAASMPKGDETRRAILAGIARVSGVQWQEMLDGREEDEDWNPIDWAEKQGFKDVTPRDFADEGGTVWSIIKKGNDTYIIGYEGTEFYGLYQVTNKKMTVEEVADAWNIEENGEDSPERAKDSAGKKFLKEVKLDF